MSQGTLAADVRSALSMIRETMQADGFDLVVEAQDDTRDLVLSVQAGPDACGDCLVPPAVLSQMVEGMIRDASIDFGSLQIEYPAGSAAADH